MRMAEIEDEAVRLFFSRGRVGNSLVVMCDNAKSTGDVITHVASVMIRTPLQIQLTLLGLQPFLGKDLLIPYDQMDSGQKEFVSKSLKEDKAWTVFESSMTLRCPNKNRMLDPLDVLEGMCQKLLGSTLHPDEQLRLVLCNIILQRVRACVPLSCALQNGLNKRLFRGMVEAYASGGVQVEAYASGGVQVEAYGSCGDMIETYSGDAGRGQDEAGDVHDTPR